MHRFSQRGDVSYGKNEWLINVWKQHGLGWNEMRCIGESHLLILRLRLLLNKTQYTLKKSDLLYTHSAWHYAAKKINQMVHRSLIEQANYWQTQQRTEVKIKRLHCTRRGVTFSFSTLNWVSEWAWQCVLIFLCRPAVSPSLPSQMPGVETDWQCSGERLSAQIDFFAPWGVDMLHLTGRRLCTVCLPC